MAKKPKRPAKPIQPGEITLYDSMLRTVGKIEPPEEQERIARIFLLLMACAEDDRLNMNKVAALLTRLSAGKFRFEHAEAEAGRPGDVAQADSQWWGLAELIHEFLTYFYGPEHIEDMKAIAREQGGTLEQIASVALAKRILERYHVTPLTEAN